MKTIPTLRFRLPPREGATATFDITVPDGDRGTYGAVGEVVVCTAARVMTEVVHVGRVRVPPQGDDRARRVGPADHRPFRSRNPVAERSAMRRVVIGA